MALALTHEGRFAEATRLLAVDEDRRRVDALPEIPRRTANGFAYRNDGGRLVVLDVLAGSPAADSNLRAGDRIEVVGPPPAALAAPAVQDAPQP